MKTSTRPRNAVQQVAAAAYFVALLLIAIPIFDALMSVAPFHLASARWRFAAVGLLSNALMIPAVGVLFAVVTAVMLDHVGTKRAIQALSWGMVVVLIASIGFFGLDSMQTRSAVRPEMHLSFLVASDTAVCKLLLGVIAFVLFGRTCRTSSVRVEVPAKLLVTREVSVNR
jgi:hypothetical protein